MRATRPSASQAVPALFVRTSSMPSAENRGTIRGGVAEAKALTLPATRGRRSGDRSASRAHGGHLLRGPRAAVPAPLSSQGQALAKARSATSAVDPDGEATVSKRRGENRTAQR